jgi:phosphopantetheine adenylyltransferase
LWHRCDPKKQPFFTLEERIQMFWEALRGYRGARNGYDRGLTAFSTARKKGDRDHKLPCMSDFEYELQMAS